MQGNLNGFSFDIPPENNDSNVAVAFYLITSRSVLLGRVELLDLISVSSLPSNFVRVMNLMEL
jgi:hypothetical protein